MSVTFDFSGKVVLITGSSSGIGAETARIMSKFGANIVVTGRNADNLSAVVKQCSDVSPNKRKAVKIVADVSNENDCKRLIDTTIREFGKLDILVNNAGFGMSGKIENPDYIQKFNSVLQTNLNSAVYLSYYSVKHLEKTKGNIINISSVGSMKCTKSVSQYCMSKSAMDMFTRCLAIQLGHKGIRVNSVNPSLVRTNVFAVMGLDETTTEYILEKYGDLYPVGRVGLSEDIVNAILYLASDQASFVTGINFIIDGGCVAANVSS